MRITVVALGKIGLPLAVQFAERGHEVIGSDVNEALVAQVNRGQEPFPGEDRLAEKLSTVVQSGRLKATTDTASAVHQAEVVVVVVPLFVSDQGEPQFEWLDSATRDIAQGLTEDTLVLYETTLPVGTTRNRWKPMLEKGSGLVEGEQFHVAFSPERVLTGRIFADLRKYPKLVGGLSEAGSKLAIAFYEDVLEFDERLDLLSDNGVWNLGSAEAAELAKLAETTYRDVNIGLANQFAIFAAAHEIDIALVIQAANSQPFSHIHSPGIAVGGHCIPVYPQLYLWEDPSASVVRAAREANSKMPEHAVNLIQAAYGRMAGARVVILGIAYRGGVKETAFSGIFPIMKALASTGASVAVHDPLYSSDEIAERKMTPYRMGDPADIVLLHTDHVEYQTLDSADFPNIKLFFDGRRTVDPSRFCDVEFMSI